MKAVEQYFRVVLLGYTFCCLSSVLVQFLFSFVFLPVMLITIIYRHESETNEKQWQIKVES